VNIADWLRSLRLTQHEAAFRDNDIDAALLPRLTNEDLKDIGVTSVGHRRRLLDAIAALRGEPDGGGGAHPIELSSRSGERRRPGRRRPVPNGGS
jgi:SAM domain (Sterile alpha motif)